MKRPRITKKLVIGGMVVLAACALAPATASAVQNIFANLGKKVVDVQAGGKLVSKVYYKGKVVWERNTTPGDIQAITANNCPTTRTRVRDARDDHTYWVRKIGNLCWMETNLAYAGGGDNAYGDVTPTITKGISDDKTVARYEIPTGSNPSSGDTDPSTSTDGGVTNAQYGYLYNFCAAMNSQVEACTGSSSPNSSANGGTPTTLFNICPLGWRLPTGRWSGEYAALNAAINSGSDSSDAGLRNNGLFMYSGYWNGSGFYRQGEVGYYWSSTTNFSAEAFHFVFANSGVADNGYDLKRAGFAVRCVAG
jgi:uncharacterized protein (TIGR02145 family)